MLVLTWKVNENKVFKVVDKNGEPLVVHHASKKQFEEYKNIKNHFDSLIEKHSEQGAFSNG